MRLEAMLMLGLLVLAAPPCCHALDITIYNKIVVSLTNLLNRPPVANTPAFLHATFLRLSFHDCAGPNGCDGCINL
jgi:hypothetical protein